MNTTLWQCNNLKGDLKIIGSKSFAHRYIIASFLSNEKCQLTNVPSSKDIEATLGCIRSLGGSFSIENGIVSMNGSIGTYDGQILDCYESGSTLRFFVPVCLALNGEARLTGSTRLIERGIGSYMEIFKEKGISYECKDNVISIKGKLKPGKYVIDGSLSSQFITGLLFALPLLEEDSVIEILPPVTSRNYILITLYVLEKFGVRASFNENCIFIPGKQKYVSTDCEVEGDYSNAAFIEAFNYLGGGIHLLGLNENSIQGDKVYREILKKLNDRKEEVDLENCIDLGPILFAFAALKHGARFIHTNRLQIKESNRALAMKNELIKVGCDVIIGDDYVEVPVCLKNEQEKTLDFDSHNDHRIAMALSLFSSISKIIIHNAEAVNKSYPGYYQDIARLGGNVNYDE